VHMNSAVLLLHSPTSSPDASAAGSILVEALLATGHDDVLPPFCALSHTSNPDHISRTIPSGLMNIHIIPNSALTVCSYAIAKWGSISQDDTFQQSQRIPTCPCMVLHDV
jgi:hypothetical protein